MMFLRHLMFSVSLAALGLLGTYLFEAPHNDPSLIQMRPTEGPARAVTSSPGIVYGLTGTTSTTATWVPSCISPGVTCSVGTNGAITAYAPSVTVYPGTSNGGNP